MKKLVAAAMILGLVGIGVALFVVLKQSQNFRQSVTTELTKEFTSYATTVNATQKLQAAELDQMELFERSSQMSVLWNQLQLPEIVVSISTPVKFPYFVELQGTWEFLIDGKELVVTAPPLIPGTPAPDLSKTKFEVKKGSLFRNEAAALRELQKEISPLLHRRAIENISLVREHARKSIEDFVQTWVAQRFPYDQKGYSVKVHFSDEVRKTP